MINRYFYFLLLLLCFPWIYPAGSAGAEPDLKTGDIIFHESWSDQGKAIKYITGAKYSHAGIILVYNKKIYVLEAGGDVKISRFLTFVNRGTGRHYVVKRLKDHDKLFNEKSLDRLQRTARGFIGKKYDYYFQWSDEKVNSGELIWKIYYRGLGVRLCGFTKLGNLDLSHPFTQMHMERQYGDYIPDDEIVVTPQMIFNSGKLKTVYEN